MARRIGIVGVSRMGLAMARNLMAAGFDATRDGGPTPLLDVTHAWYDAAVEAGHTGRDQASIFEYLVDSASS